MSIYFAHFGPLSANVVETRVGWDSIAWPVVNFVRTHLKMIFPHWPSEQPSFSVFAMFALPHPLLAFGILVNCSLLLILPLPSFCSSRL